MQEIPVATCLVLVLAAFLLTAPAPGAAPVEPVLPPTAAWSGASRALALPADHPWATPFEISGLTETPRYDDTVAWLERLVAASPQLRMLSLGKSAEGRDIHVVVASKDGAATPAELHAAGRPVALVHAGIHAGEIDGKDAGMMLLRDLTVRGTRRELLDRASLLFIPILSVDGHERFSAHGRINQRGPARMGWRTNARNLNLNRDFSKLDTPEVRALVAAINEWRPDLYIDLHVTDGMDFQYDVTWGYNGPHAHSPAVAGWLDGRLTPAAEEALRTMGHVPGPLFFPADRADQTRGLVEWTASPRFSNGYGDARHLASIVVENHSLKPFDRRVLGTYVLLESFLRTLGEHGAELKRATEADRRRRPAEVALGWRVPSPPPGDTFELAGIEQRLRDSQVSGGQTVEWTGAALALEVPWLPMSEPTVAVAAPAAWWIPPPWPEVIRRLQLHGIELERLAEARTVEVEMYRVREAELDPQPFEGHVRVTARAEPERRTETFPAGSVRVPADQPLGILAALLLEPGSPDSFFQWGFFLEVLQRTEYVEGYVMEPTARRMLAADPDLAAEFRQKLLDPEFAGDPRERLQWFYRRTPWFDERFELYPVAREPAPPSSPRR